MEFEFDPKKSEANSTKHGIDFIQAQVLWDEGMSDTAIKYRAFSGQEPSKLFVVIAGSGHVAQAVAPLAQQLDFSVTVFDDRPELANDHYFPAETKLRVGGWHELLKVPPPVTPAFGLVVTRGHQHDALVLSEWIRFPFAFLGMIGSRRKARILRENFLKQNLATPEQFDRIACPVGLDIAAVGPQEIAVSVMAQFIQQRAALRQS